MADKTQAERITALEVQVANLTLLIVDQSRKIEDLLALKYKGVGAFWLASALMGTGIVGTFMTILNWLKG